MSNNKHRKQAKRKARQRAIKAAKHTAKHSAPVFGGHAMSDSMKAEAKDAFWKVFSTLPPQLQKESLESFKQDGGKVSGLDIKGITKILQEGLTHYMHPHALCAIMERMDKESKFELTEEMSTLISRIDDSVIRYINGATFILETFEQLKDLDQEQLDVRLAENEEFTDTLMATLLAFQEDSESCIQPLIDLATPHTELLDAYAAELRTSLNVETQYEFIKGLHLDRLNRLVTAQE